jgi:Ca-activated chloride channel homolog
VNAKSKSPRIIPTFIEILIVLGILALLAGLLLPSLAKSKAKARAQRSHFPVVLEDVAAAARPADQPGNTEAYDYISDNPFLAARENPLSTFSIDVDTASYANVRRFLNERQLPPKDAVRIEELLNYFTYDYPLPKDEHPFAAHVEIADCPWNSAHRLARLGLKGKVIKAEQRPACNLVFLIDVSGSMEPANKLPLLIRSLELLVEQLSEKDRVAIVVYAGGSGLVLESTPGSDKRTLLSALKRLKAGGSTNGGAGIELAYQTAVLNLIKGGANRVILCTDGDFNVGVSSAGELTRLIKDKARSGVFLTVLGFGMGNYKDGTLERLADLGNGNYGYIDSLAEAKKMLVEQLSGTLITIAKDVKIQIEFNPAQVNAYRLIGYENRMLRSEDFNDDQKDAGELGSGHTVTALYEIVPAETSIKTGSIDPLKYQKANSIVSASTETMTIKLRYKLPDGEESNLMNMPVTDSGLQFIQASRDFKFAAGVAAFGMVLRDSAHKGSADFALAEKLARDGNDRTEHRREFIELIHSAAELKGFKTAMRSRD